MRITPELLRKRAEHNAGVLSTLEEITLHQYKIRRIECLDEYCRKLRILLLQSNKIRRIENLSRLKDLRYLNLALNRITRIENLGGLESLEKLDLTANYIADYRELRSLSGLGRLRELYLTGNPCTEQPYYREFALTVLPHLEKLDGTEISRSERLQASRTVTLHRDEINAVRCPSAHPDWDAESEGSDYEDNDPGEKVRRAAAETAVQEAEKRGKVVKPENRPSREKDPALGRVRQYNELGARFWFEEAPRTRELVFCIDMPVFLSTSSIEVDVQPESVLVRSLESGRQTVVALPYEVYTTGVRATRISTTGVLKVRMRVMEGVEMDGALCPAGRPERPRETPGAVGSPGRPSSAPDSESEPALLGAALERARGPRTEVSGVVTLDVDDADLEDSVPSDVPDLL